MESTKYLIIGSGIAGTTAAQTIRNLDPDARIVLAGDEVHPLYSRVALPPYMRGKTTRERVFLKQPDFYEQQHIEWWASAQATGLDRADQVVAFADGRRVHYERLLIATGSRPRPWNISGGDLDGVLRLRTIEDADHTLARLKQAKHVVIAGGGFIALELIMTMAQEGVATTVVIREPYFWANLLDEESAHLIQQLIHQPHIDFLYGQEVAEVSGRHKVDGVVLSSGKHLKANLVLVNIGVESNSDWLAGSGLELGAGVHTDEFMQSSDASIFAAGDIAEFFDPILGVRHHMGNWLNATITGKLAGHNMAGQRQPMHAVSAYSISVFGTNVSFVGTAQATASMTVVPRGSAKQGAYGRILVDRGRVVGATLINRFTDKEPISRLVASGVDVTPHIGHLSDVTVDLKHLVDQLVHPDTKTTHL
jgi:3-phenylpropionate/trans-cinnamate dioxygenase ferredoxin reductase subunit